MNTGGNAGGNHTGTRAHSLLLCAKVRASGQEKRINSVYCGPPKLLPLTHALVKSNTYKYIHVFSYQDFDIFLSKPDDIFHQQFAVPK
jgi:hypothetical protein